MLRYYRCEMWGIVWLCIGFLCVFYAEWWVLISCRGCNMIVFSFGVRVPCSVHIGQSKSSTYCVEVQMSFQPPLVLCRGPPQSVICVSMISWLFRLFLSFLVLVVLPNLLLGHGCYQSPQVRSLLSVWAVASVVEYMVLSVSYHLGGVGCLLACFQSQWRQVWCY